MEVQYGVIALYWEAVQWPLAPVQSLHDNDVGELESGPNLKIEGFLLFFSNL